MKIGYIIFISLFLGISTIVDAKCRKSYVCGDHGSNCRYMDICDSTIDLPSIDINPLPAMPATRLKPLKSIDLPPLGTSQCEYEQVNGRWRNICW